MRVSLDPFPQRKAAAVAAVNAHFGSTAAAAAMRESAWVRKRDIARRHSNERTYDFEMEARLRGLSSDELADLILSKPDPTALADARELQRQTALIAIDAAKTPAELDAIIAGLGT